MRREKRKRSSDAMLLAGIQTARLHLSGLRQLLFDLANSHDERLDWLRDKYSRILMGRYSTAQLASYRDELRLLWHPAKGIPHKDFEEFERWRKVRPEAEPGEMICNRWLGYSATGLLAVWDRGRRELVPVPDDLPGLLVYACLLFGDRLRYCQNRECAAPWFIGTRNSQRYCSNECAWPAKKAAKLKWWKENRVKKFPILSPRKQNEGNGR